MLNGDRFRRRKVLRAGVVALLALAYAGAGLYLRLVLHTDQVYTHLAYVPIVLAGMWWGRKGSVVAGLLGLVVLVHDLLGLGAADLASDLARVTLFIVVGLCVGWLSERVRRGERALRISEAKHRLLTEKSLAGICVYRNERVLFANERLGAMLGCAPADLVGRSIWDFIHEPDQPKVRDLLARREAEGLTDLHYECRFLRRDGRVIWTDLASALAEYEGAPAVLVHLYDITEMRATEEQRRELSELARRQEEQLVHSTRLAELGEMAAGVAHELNQPLTGIRNFARNALYMLQTGAADSSRDAPDVQDNLRLITEQVDRAARIISQMRELTRRSERQFALIDINAVLTESVEFLTPQMRLAGVDVRLDLAPDLPEVMGDRIRLEQVFLNLLTNARQAMEESRERRLTVRTWLDRSGGQAVAIEVADTGNGFPPEVAERLFTPFFSTKKPGHGTGLGLSISLTIVKDHRGTIQAVGAPGAGARFTVRLPLPAEPHPADEWD
jgi:PAS domain S-box-containing protein